MCGSVNRSWQSCARRQRIAPASAASVGREDSIPASVLTPEEWQRVDASVDRALRWLAIQQQHDGSFPTLATGQPAVTSLCVLAFGAHGHLPGVGTYGHQLERATDYVLSCQKENGLVTLIGPGGPQITRDTEHEIGACAAYNHAISSLTLSEVFGMSPPNQMRRLQAAIDRSLEATLEIQHWPKDAATDRGGWRYIDDFDRTDSDLSVTGWQLMFLRSAQTRVSTCRSSGSTKRSPTCGDLLTRATVFLCTRHAIRVERVRWPVRGSWRSRMLAFTIRRRRGGPATGCLRMDSATITRRFLVPRPTGITMGCSIAARRCINSAESIGRDSFPRRCGRCWQINWPTARGLPTRNSTTAPSAVPTRPRSL